MTREPTAATPARLEWQLATVVGIRDETPHARTLVLDVPGWPGHRAGQHVDVRLVADDGYEAQRSYSIASAPEDSAVELTVERIENAEVSPYLCDVLRVDDGLEVRGPIGGYFVWTPALGGPILLIAGGSGIVPFRSILRHRAATHSAIGARLLYSARSIGDVIYRDELTRLATNGTDVALTLTREWPQEWTGYRRRIDMDLLREFAWTPAERPLVYVCGPSGFVESAANALVALGHDAERIRTERFGPTGT